MNRNEVSAAEFILRVAVGASLLMLAGSGSALALTRSDADRGSFESGAAKRILLPPPTFELAVQGAAPTSGGEPGEAAPDSAPATPVAPPGEGAESVDQPLPVILRSDSDLPEPVRETRRKLIEAAKTGDIEKLRVLMNAQAEPPSVAFGDPGDPVEYLKALAADADGREILAILLEVLQSGFVHVGAGTADEQYIWPYFAQYPLDALTPEQLVELFTLLTAADYEDMKSYGAYTFFRVGIAPDGRWLFFLAGD